MITRRRFSNSFFISAVLVACSDPGSAENGLAETASAEGLLARDAGVAPDVEDIYVFRSIPVPLTDEAFCDSAPFPSVGGGGADLYSIKVGVNDALLTDAQKKLVGHVNSCLGVTEDPARLNFYTSGEIDDVEFTGLGKCDGDRVDFPEPGLIWLRCFLDIGGLPAGYVGGLLTSNANFHDPADPTAAPPGYLSQSIVTLRLWKSP